MTKRPIRSAALLGTIAGLIGALGAQSKIKPYGLTCGPVHGGTVSYAGTQRLLVLDVLGAPQNSPGLLILGVQRSTAQFPGPCPLHVLPLIALPISIDGRGAATAPFAFPAVSSIGTTFSQVLTVDTVAQRWITSNGLELGPFSGVIEVAELFRTRTFVDPELEGARWGLGPVVPAELGGTAVLGEFRATDGVDSGKKDSAGRTIRVFDVDALTVPASRTLTGTPIRVTNGVLEYASFKVAANEHVRFVGSKPVVLKVAGAVDIQGVVDLYVGSFLDHAPDQAMPARLGGAAGGTPAAIPGGSASIHGGDGGDVVVPRGHPRAGLAVGTGGKGSTAFPVSGLTQDVVWVRFQNFDIFVRQLACGGGGGAFFDAGSSFAATDGVVTRTAIGLPILGPYTAAEIAPPTMPGRVFPVLPEIAGRASFDTFLLGGAGGGGTGTHAAYTATKSRYTWSRGGAGGAGGGAIAVRSGGPISIIGVLSARGVDGAQTRNFSGTPPAIMPGGAGSGGSVLLQSARAVASTGSIDVRGGTSGSFQEITPLIDLRCDGGAGGAGYWRAEAPVVPKATDFANCLPPVDASKNLAGLRRDDHEAVSGLGSTWYHFAGRTTYVGYEVDARVDGVDVTYGDRSANSRRAKDGEAVVLRFQSASLDASGNVVTATPWVTGDLALLNSIAARGDALRFHLSLDTAKTVTGAVEVRAVRIVAGD